MKRVILKVDLTSGEVIETKQLSWLCAMERAVVYLGEEEIRGTVLPIAALHGPFYR